MSSNLDLTSLTFSVGENIKYLAVRVLNKNREVLISPPGSTRKYRVRMTSPTMGKDFGTSLITYSRENTERVVFMSSDKVKDAHQVLSIPNIFDKTSIGISSVSGFVFQREWSSHN